MKKPIVFQILTILFLIAYAAVSVPLMMTYIFIPNSNFLVNTILPILMILGIASTVVFIQVGEWD